MGIVKTRTTSLSSKGTVERDLRGNTPKTASRRHQEAIKRQEKTMGGSGNYIFRSNFSSIQIRIEHFGYLSPLSNFCKRLLRRLWLPVV